MDRIKSALNEGQRNSEAVKAFGYRLHNQFAINEAHRRQKELEWLESLRQYKGLYDPGVYIEPNNSKVYPKLTRSKVNIVLSRLHEMLFPDTDKNWEIGPTPEPRIDKKLVQDIAESMIVEDPETGEMTAPTREDIKLAIMQYVKNACELMALTIDDQLTEMDYSEETKKVLRSGLMYGTGVLKGPMIKKREKRRWEPDTTTGDYTESVETDDVPYYKFVRLWDWYPDMSVTDQEHMEGAFERHIMTKHDLRLLMKRDDFYADLIKEYLSRHPSGDYVPKNWEADLQVIQIEAAAGTAEKGFTSSGSSDTKTQSATSTQLGKKYQVLEFWGYIDGYDLESCGVKLPGGKPIDVGLEYSANVWMIGNIPIKITLFDGALKQYKLFYYEKDETSIFGEGLARVMRHSQLAIAAAARMVLDNGAVVSGPQLEVNMDLLSPGTDYNSIYPRKMWFRKGRGIDAQYPAVRDLSFDSHIAELISIIDTFKQFSDEETTLPTWMIGQMVNNETAQATSGRQAAINISIKDVVKNFDTFTEHAIGDLYNWNMEFNPRTDIKGDYEVKPRGVSSLVMKEIRMQALTQLSTTLMPEDYDYIDRRDLLKEKLKAHDLNIPLKSEEEADKSREARENSRAQQLAYAQAEADVAYKKAQTMAQLTKAKKTNVEALKDSETPPENPNIAADPRMQDAELAKKQAEIDKINTESGIKVAQLESDIAKRQQEMEDEHAKNSLEAAHSHEKHMNELEMSNKTAEHGMKLKEKTAMAAAKSKAVNKPVSRVAKVAKVAKTKKVK